MKAATRLFGEIEIDESKIITFEDGIIGLYVSQTNSGSITGNAISGSSMDCNQEMDGLPSFSSSKIKVNFFISGNGSAVRL